MPWTYKPPMNFPAVYGQTIREAVLTEQPAYLGGFESLGEFKKLAENFRYYRWCVRERPDATREMFLIESSYDIRLSFKKTEAHILGFVTARRTKLADFTALNPELALELFAQCQ